MKQKEREYWVDNVKVVACILVVLGHFFQSMTKSYIIEANALYEWFNRTIYYFHVPLFFICSGYLYQKNTEVVDFDDWLVHIANKFIVLGIPYFIFSFATWVLKTLFSGNVNEEIEGLAKTLFIKPASPYWYLYVLFFLFLCVPCIKNKKQYCLLLAFSMIVKILYIEGLSGHTYLIPKICDNCIWFVGGMGINYVSFGKVQRKLWVEGSVFTLMLFTIFSIMVFVTGISFKYLNFIMGLMACIGIVSGIKCSLNDNEQKEGWRFAARYTMPIFLMHTLFAAPVRVVLFKIGIHNTYVHVLIGLFASFIGPIIAMKIMEMTKYLVVFVYPNKFIKIKRREKWQQKKN